MSHAFEYLSIIILKSHFDILFIQYHWLPVTYAENQNIGKCVKISTVTPLQTLTTHVVVNTFCLLFQLFFSHFLHLFSKRNFGGKRSSATIRYALNFYREWSSAAVSWFIDDQCLTLQPKILILKPRHNVTGTEGQYLPVTNSRQWTSSQTCE